MDEKDNSTNVIDKSEYFSKVQEAIKTRDKFLEEHPELKGFQREIEKELRKAVSWKNKAAVLKTMMDEQMWKLKKELMKIQEITYKLNPVKGEGE